MLCETSESSVLPMLSIARVTNVALLPVSKLVVS